MNDDTQAYHNADLGNLLSSLDQLNHRFREAVSSEDYGQARYSARQMEQLVERLVAHCG